MSASPESANTPIGSSPHGEISHRLVCTEVWGGNNIVDLNVEVPGLAGWVYSKPLEPAAFGGDVYGLSVCSKGLLSRIVLADVAGHGQAVSATAITLRNLLRKHMNALDQSRLMQEINEAFRRDDNPDDVQYATAAVLGYYCQTGDLIFTNAGHPAALWYHAKDETWDWLHEDTRYAEQTIEGVPLGLIPGTEYSQSAVRLAAGDLLILYTDGISESRNEAEEELGYNGLLELVRQLPRQTIHSPGAAGRALLAAVGMFRGLSSCFDDQTILVLQRGGLS